MAENRGRGRPPAENPKGSSIMVRVTAEQRELIEQAAGETPVSTWVREKAIAAAKRAVR